MIRPEQPHRPRPVGPEPVPTNRPRPGTTHHTRLDPESAGKPLPQWVVDSAVHAINGARWASITSYASHRFHTAVASDGADGIARQADQMQYDTGQGPCLSASVGTGRVMHSTDLTEDRRWPLFSAQAHHLGVRSVLSCRISTDHGSVGSLNLYADTTHAFTEFDEHLCRLLIVSAALALSPAECSPTRRMTVTRFPRPSIERELQASRLRLINGGRVLKSDRR